MNSTLREEIWHFVESNVDSFQSQRLESLQRVTLEQLLLQHDPYYYCLKSTPIIGKLVIELLDRWLCAREEAALNQLLKELAIVVCLQVNNGWKSSLDRIDVEFDRDGIRYLVAISSYTDRINPEQIKELEISFLSAKHALSQKGFTGEIKAVIGTYSGRNNQPDQGDYLYYCGKQFWQFISWEKQFYLEIVEPIQRFLSVRTLDYKDNYSRIANLLTIEFFKRFYSKRAIDPVKLVRFFNEAKPH